MPNITLNTHIISKHDTAQNWANSSYIPYDGEIVISSNNTAGPYGRNQTEIKIGNGIDAVSNIAGLVPSNTLRYTTLNGGGFDRIYSYGNVGMNIGDYALVVSNQNYPGVLNGSIVQVSNIGTSTFPNGYTMYNVFYKTIYEPSSSSSTLYYHTVSLNMNVTSRGSTSTTWCRLNDAMHFYSSSSCVTANDLLKYLPTPWMVGTLSYTNGTTIYSANYHIYDGGFNGMLGGNEISIVTDEETGISIATGGNKLQITDSATPI